MRGGPATGCTGTYLARNPLATPLYRLSEHHFEEVRGQWEDRFERQNGCWRGMVYEQVLGYLDCGLFENGFTRVRFPDCAEEYLLAFSRKTRELGPSCVSEMKVILMLRLYWPAETPPSIIDGTWKIPAVEIVK